MKHFEIKRKNRLITQYQKDSTKKSVTTKYKGVKKLRDGRLPNVILNMGHLAPKNQLFSNLFNMKKLTPVISKILISNTNYKALSPITNKISCGFCTQTVPPTGLTSSNRNTNNSYLFIWNEAIHPWSREDHEKLLVFYR